MKIPTKGSSRFLGKDDVPAPFVALIDCVTVNKELRNPFVLHFQDGRIKPLPLNKNNRCTLVAAYGDEDSAWHGRPVEIYVNPDVTNSSGEVVGGIRVRIPATPTPAPSGTPRPSTSSAPSGTPRPSTSSAPAKPTAAQNVTRALQGMDDAQTRAGLDSWASWGKGIPGLNDDQRSNLERAYTRNLNRLASPRQPARHRS